MRERPRIIKKLFYLVYYPCSVLWLKLDRLNTWKEYRFWADHAPGELFTSFASYTGWIYNQGFFSSLLDVFLKQSAPCILDFGCGMGPLAPVCYHFVKSGGRYLGIDLDLKSIEACKKRF